METSSKDANNQSVEWLTVGDPLLLGDAGYLRDILRQKGIQSRIDSKQRDKQLNEAIHIVLVSAQDHPVAMTIRREVIDDLVTQKGKQKGGHGKKLIILWGFAILMGLRVASKEKDAFSWTVIGAGILALMVYTVWRRD